LEALRVSFLVLTVSVALVLGVGLLALVLRAVHEGAFDDLDAPAARHHEDDDRAPEREGDARGL
jgi:cbb3-type cytochrome oxidase maturation protein